MKGLGSLLDRFKDSLDKDIASREMIAECIKEAAGLDIRLEDISIKNDTLRIRTSPVKRSEINLHEAEILKLSALKTKLNLKRITY
ncbi:hypothetical protein KW796_02415 [Candidatus Parcubacteria bacterium]|nr:hypothetical protein [Candidatus Parcubacteria bacterium]